MKELLPICDKDDALISCRKIILRLLNKPVHEDVPDYLRTYANSVANQAFGALDAHAKPVADKET